MNNTNSQEEITINYDLSLQNDIWLIFIGAIILTASFLWKDVLTDIQDYYMPKYFGENLFKRVLFTIIVTICLISFAIYLRDRLRRTQNTNNIPNIINLS